MAMPKTVNSSMIKDELSKDSIKFGFDHESAKPKASDGRGSPGAKKAELVNDFKLQKDWYHKNLAK